MKSDAPKVPKLAKANRDGVINPQNYNFNQFKQGFALDKLGLQLQTMGLHLINYIYRT